MTQKNPEKGDIFLDNDKDYLLIIDIDSYNNNYLEDTPVIFKYETDLDTLKKRFKNNELYYLSTDNYRYADILEFEFIENVYKSKIIKDWRKLI